VWKNKQIHLVRDRTGGYRWRERCVVRGPFVLQTRCIRVTMGMPLSFAKPLVRTGVSALMKHVHRWQLSRRRHDNGRPPNVKGRSAGWLVGCCIPLRFHQVESSKLGEPGYSPAFREFRWVRPVWLNSRAPRKKRVIIIPRMHGMRAEDVTTFLPYHWTNVTIIALARVRSSLRWQSITGVRCTHRTPTNPVLCRVCVNHRATLVAR